jgi:hypothetical protein
MPLFEIAVIRNWEDMNEKDHEELILAPVAVLSKNEKAAALQFVMDEADQLKEYEAEELEIIVRPFA